MGTDSKTAIQQPSSKVTIVTSSSSSSKNIKKKKSKTSHHKSKHNKQQRSESSSSRSSNDYERNTTSSSSKKPNKTKNSKDKNKLSSSNETRNTEKKSTTNKKKSHRSKHDSSESPPKRNNTTRSRSKSRSRSDRSTDRSSSRESPSRYRYKNPLRRPGSSMQNVYAPMPHANFPPNMPRHYAPPTSRGGRMPPYMPPGMMGGPPMRNNNGNRRSGGNSPPQSLLGGYRPPPGTFRGRGGPMNNPAYVHNMANMLNLIQQQQQQQKQKPGSHKYANPNNPNNRFYQQFQDNYKRISSGQKISNLYQASFPVQHIPREMRFNFRLLGRNIFTASDEEEEEQKKQAAAAAAAATGGGSSEKRSKQRRDSSSSSDSRSDDDRRKRRDEDNDDEEEKPSNTKSKSSPSNKTSNEQKRSSTKNNRNRTSSSTATQHSKSTSSSHDLLTDTSNLSTFLAGIMQSENPEMMANTIVNAANAVNNKRERTKKQQEKKVQKFKNYARFQQTQATAGGVVPQTNPEEVEKKIHGLARRLQMKTIGLHDDYESQGIKRSDESSVDSDGNQRRHRSSGSSTERSKDKEAGSDGSTNSQRQRKLKKMKNRTNKKVNAAGQLIGSSDDEQHRSDGNNSDGSMRNLNEDLKPISYYMKDRERMLHEMFRCVRGHKLQAILPDALKTRSLDEIKAKCLDQLDILSKKRIRAILLAHPMTSSSGTEDSTDEDEQDFFTLYPHLKSSLDVPVNNGSIAPTANTTTTTTTPPPPINKKFLANSKFRPVPMQAVNETTPSTFQSTLSAPIVVGGDEDVNDYYEGFKKIKKLANLRRNEQDDEFLPFPDQSGKLLQPFGSTFPRFEFKPITGLTHSQQLHLNARRAAHRQQQQQMDVRQEIDDLLNIEDFVLPEGERPLSSAELSINEQRRYGLPPRLHHKIPAGPPKKGSLGDLLKQKTKQSGERSPSPLIDETNSKRQRQRRRRSRSLSSTGSGQWSRSSSLSNNDERTSRHSSRDMSPTNENKKSEEEIEDDVTNMNDLSKLLDLNEEDELLLLQIEVEQEERNIRREEKRRRKEEKKTKKSTKKSKILSNTDEQQIIHQCLYDLIEKLILQEETKINSKRTFDDSEEELSKKIKLEEIS